MNHMNHEIQTWLSSKLGHIPWIWRLYWFQSLTLRQVVVVAPWTLTKHFENLWVSLHALEPSCLTAVSQRDHQKYRIFGCRALALYHFQVQNVGIGIASGRTYPSSVAHPSLQATKDGSSGPSRRLETGRSRARGQLQGGMGGQLGQSETGPGRANVTSFSEHLIMTYEKIAIQ